MKFIQKTIVTTVIITCPLLAESDLKMDSTKVINDAKILYKIDSEKTIKELIDLELFNEIVHGCKAILIKKLGLDSDYYDNIEFNSNIQKDLGADSLDVVEIIMECEKFYGITVKDEDAEGLIEFGDFVKYIYSEMIKNPDRKEFVIKEEIKSRKADLSHIDWSEIEMYKYYGNNDFFFGKYKNGSNHIFYTREDLGKWEILISGSELWDSFDQRIWSGDEIESVESYELPDWITKLPTVEELEQIETIKWEDNFKGKEIYQADEYRHLKNYFENNGVKEVKIYFALGEDRYESVLGDGIFRYLCKVSFDKKEIEEFIDFLPKETENSFAYLGFLKEHTIKYDGHNFTIPDFKPEMFESYEQDDLIKIADEKFDSTQLKYYELKGDSQKCYVVAKDNSIYSRGIDEHNPNEWILVEKDIEFNNDKFFHYSQTEFEHKVGWVPKFDVK
jgi:acyl carrier protein